MTFSIIIVNWNVKTLIERCLASIEKYKGSEDCEVFVVDNASSDDSWGYLVYYETNTQKNPKHPLYGRFMFIANKENRGFAAANNQAMIKATGEYIFLLNPDTELTPGALAGLRSFMEMTPKCGVAGVRLLEPPPRLPLERGGVTQTQPSVRRFPDALSLVLLSLGVHAGSVHHYLASNFDYRTPAKVDQVMGAAFCIRRSCLDEVGRLDERFFIWFEEVDYCRRVWNAGWEVWYTPSASIVHHGGKSFAQAMTLAKQRIFFSSLLKYFWKWRQYGAWLVTLACYPMRLLVAFMLSLGQRSRKKI